MITNYSGNFVDSESRQAIEIMSNTIQSLFYGKDFRNEIVKQAKEVIYPQIKQEIVSSSLETEQRILGKIKEAGTTYTITSCYRKADTKTSARIYKSNQ